MPTSLANQRIVFATLKVDKDDHSIMRHTKRRMDINGQLPNYG